MFPAGKGQVDVAQRGDASERRIAPLVVPAGPGYVSPPAGVFAAAHTPR